MKKILFFFIIAITVLSGCKTAQPSFSDQAPSGVGYSLRNNTVLFEFHPEQFKWVTNGTTGKWVDITAIPIREVTIAGDFNNWSTANTRMIFDGTSFYLPLSYDLFAKHTAYQFKYVINGEWWVEPPRNTLNAASTKLENNGSNLVLIVN